MMPLGSLSKQIELQNWLTEIALPYWATHGVDRNGGGYFEQLTFDGKPVAVLRRARLTARQIYCFAIGRELGWSGNAEELVRHGLQFLVTRLMKKDGSVIKATSVDGSVVDDRYDPYDYAFVLFALASAARKLADMDEMLAIAVRIRDQLVASWSHPQIGFEESSPRSLPLRANPHMHLFEAFLAWAELVGTRDPTWQLLADEMAKLVLTKLISPKTGAISEYFDGDWRPLPDSGDITVEPGHQFEWAWLLARWSLTKNDTVAFNAAVRLVEIGEEHGMDTKCGIVLNALDGNLSLRDGAAKLWPQTERIKAWYVLSEHIMNSNSDRDAARRRIPDAIAGLQKFIVDVPSGLWRDMMRQDGSFVEQPVRASSLYHITCAVHTLSIVKPSVREQF